MFEQELKKALHASRPVPPEGFDGRSDRQIAQLTRKEGIHVKKFSVLMIAAAVLLILTMATALAAGIISWRRGLEDKLQVTEDIRTAYRDTQLFEEPGLSVTQNGVTVTMDQCIVEPNAAYVSFRVKGYQPQITRNSQYLELPQFRDVLVELDGQEDVCFVEPLFFDGLDALGRLADGSAPENDDLPYLNENGEMVFILSMRSDEDGFSFVGKNLHVRLGGLGIESTKYVYDTVRVDVQGVWEFAWTLKGTSRRVKLDGLSMPVGQDGSVLTDLSLSPIYINMLMRVPREPVPSDPDTTNAPLFRGVRLIDGTVLDYLAWRGYNDYLADSGEAYRQAWALNRIIDPEQVESLLFSPAWHDSETAEVIEVKIR